MVGCPRVAVAVGGGWCPRVWRWQFGVIGVHVSGGGSFMWFVPTCMAVEIGCDWCPRVWQWQLHVIGTHVFGGGSWTW